MSWLPTVIKACYFLAALLFILGLKRMSSPRTARDGIEDVELLPQIKPDLVLTDLEMPRMNGIELTAHIRNQASQSQLPVIMITSRTTQKHRQLAEDAGIDAYLAKPVRDDDLLMKIMHLLP